MSKVTSKLQVTIPKAVAQRFGIIPGAEIEFVPEGDTLRVATPRARRVPLPTSEERLRVFHELVERVRARAQEQPAPIRAPGEGRGWTREDLYGDRGSPR